MNRGFKKTIKRITLFKVITKLLNGLILVGKKEYKVLNKVFNKLFILPRGVVKIFIKVGYGIFTILEALIYPFVRIIKNINNSRESKKRTAEIMSKVRKNIEEKQEIFQEKVEETIEKAEDIFKEKIVEKIYPKKQSKFLRLKPIISFAVLALLIIAPIKIYDNYTFFKSLKIKLVDSSQAAVNDLISAKSSITDKDFHEASTNFSQASDNFLNTEKELNSLNDSLFALAKIIPNEKIKMIGDSKHFAKAGQLTSELGMNLTKTMDSLFKNEGEMEVANMLNDFTKYGYQALDNAEELNKTLKKISEKSIPEEYREEFLTLREKGDFLEQSLNELLDIADKLKIFLGTQYDKRYLLVFQNNTEARATGGFMGSFALVDFSNGKIKNMEVPKGGTYDTEYGLKRFITAPEPLHLVNPLWHFWDCNWWPDWTMSAKKIMWFYEKSDGPTVDGVISFTPNVIINLLKVIGPVDMTEDYDVIITADNFLEVAQTFAEEKPDDLYPEEKHEPKAIIGDLMDKIIEQITVDLNKEKLIKLISGIEESLNQKHTLLYFTDEELQNKITHELGWGGEIKEAKQDYLMIINTNIAGAKSDKKIKQRIYYNPEILPDGTMLAKLTIEREHTAIRGETFSGVRNVNWLRIYTPKGSELIKAEGFNRPDRVYFEEPEETWEKDPDLLHEEELAIIDEKTGVKIYTEKGKTVFADWSMVDPGETDIIKLVYKLPFKIENKKSDNFLEEFKKSFDKKELLNYTFLAQKQSGSFDSEIYFNIKHNGHDLVWKYPENDNTNFDVDKYWALLLSTDNLDY